MVDAILSPKISLILKRCLTYDFENTVPHSWELQSSSAEKSS
jgi:hypothetical protein